MWQVRHCSRLRLAHARSRTSALAAVTISHVLIVAICTLPPSRRGQSETTSERDAIQIVSIDLPQKVQAADLPPPAIARPTLPVLILPVLTLGGETHVAPVLPVTARESVPAPSTPDERQGMQTMTERALRDLPAIDREPGSRTPNKPLRLRHDSFTARLERGIATAARITVIRHETVQLGDGRIMTKIITNRGSKCYASRSAGLTGGRDVFQSGVGGARAVKCSD